MFAMKLSKTKILNIACCISLGFIAQVLSLSISAQCLTHQQFWDSTIAIENSPNNIDRKLKTLFQLKEQYRHCKMEQDSVFARMLHRIGAFQYQQGQYADAIQNTKAAVSINTSGKVGACYWYAGVSYYNLGLCYNQLSIYNEVFKYLDSLDLIYKNFPQLEKFVVTSKLIKGRAYYKNGDFEKDIEELTVGFQLASKLNDTPKIIMAMLGLSEAHEMQKKIDKAIYHVDTSIYLLQTSKSVDYESWANAYRYRANILADQNNCRDAINLFNKCIFFRKKINTVHSIAQDYNDAGYLLMYKCNNLTQAKKYFDTAYLLAMKSNDNGVAAFASNNMAQINFQNGDYFNTLKLYQQALQLLAPHSLMKDVFNNPSYKDLIIVENKSFLEIVLDNKSKNFLYLYKQTNKPEYLHASISTALLADSVITDMRHGQLAEQSKLYWSKDTRDFFTRTIEACYLSNNPQLAFYFMEKSRAVLLNDKLNELGAASKLPPAESAKEEKLQINIVEQQQKLSSLNEGSPEYSNQQVKFLNAKDDYEHYIKSLEQKYPNYYQYKYADEVPSLKTLQEYLSKNNESFVHYFTGDTITYILAITASNAKFIRLSKNEFDNTQLIKFLQYCSDKNFLNNHYDLFASLSNAIYKNLFLPLQLPKGHAIICLDNFVIPFEALCTDVAGKHFLLNDYSFSYVYAARNLLAYPDVAGNASGNFLGIAPVSFSSYMNEADLLNSSDAINVCAKYYSASHVLTGKDANKKNFFAFMRGYSIVNIFSHAVADSTETEPKLFLQDSVIHLSELQLIQRPATALVVLSACETNMGKNATGEGIYSLARGFTAAGIPSVAATLWNADDQSIYTITKSFNYNLSKGMNKDDALRQAKLDYIKNNHDEKLLPYYWGNMIIIGNTEPVRLSVKHNRWWVWIAGFLIIIAGIIFKKLNATIPTAKE